MLWTLIPAAGASARFVAAGYTIPKPFLLLSDGRSMLEAVGALAPAYSKVLVALPGEATAPPWCSSIIPVYRITKGQAETVAIMAALIPEDAEVLVINCDQVTDFPMEEFIFQCKATDAVAGVLTIPGNNNPAYSYVCGWPRVTEAREKDPFSEYAVAGFYWFRTAGTLLAAIRCEEPSSASERYLTPALNWITTTNVKLPAGYHVTSWGTPEEYERNR